MAPLLWPGKAETGTQPQKLAISGRVDGSSATVILCGHSAASTLTDSNGNYRFADLEKGRYVLLISRPGFVFTPQVIAVDLEDADAGNVDSTATAQVPPGHSVRLNWAPGGPLSTNGYRLYRATSVAGPYELINPTSLVLETSYMDTHVSAGQTYYYISKAVDSEGVESSPSEPITVHVPDE